MLCDSCKDTEDMLYTRGGHDLCGECAEIYDNTFGVKEIYIDNKEKHSFCLARAHTKYDPVSKPKHYNVHPSGMECIDITRHMNFNLGNSIKYIWRAGEKGDKVEDLKKAVWYLQDEIKRIEHERKQS